MTPVVLPAETRLRMRTAELRQLRRRLGQLADRWAHDVPPAPYYSTEMNRAYESALMLCVSELLETLDLTFTYPTDPNHPDYQDS